MKTFLVQGVLHWLVRSRLREEPMLWPEYRKYRVQKYTKMLCQPTTKSPAVWSIIFLQRAPLAVKVSCCAVIVKLVSIGKRKHAAVVICCLASVAHLACEKSNKITSLPWFSDAQYCKMIYTH